MAVGYSGREIFQHVGDRDPEPANRGFPAPFPRVDSNAIGEIGVHKQCLRCRRERGKTRLLTAAINGHHISARCHLPQIWWLAPFSFVGAKRSPALFRTSRQPEPA